MAYVKQDTCILPRLDTRKRSACTHVHMRGSVSGGDTLICDNYRRAARRAHRPLNLPHKTRLSG